MDDIVKRPGFDSIRIARHYRCSIRIDADFGRTDALDGYVLTGTAREVIAAMARQITGSNQRAFTWTGPYGGGKSSIAVTLASALCNDADLRKRAHQILRPDTILNFAKAFPITSNGWLVVPVVGKRAIMTTEISKARHKALGCNPSDTVGKTVLNELLESAESGDYDGVLLLIDEMGKFLEASSTGGDDVHFFQDLAEAAARSKGRLVVVGILHQAFRQYASRLGVSAREEWAKVQGRFSDIPFVATGDEAVELLGRAIECDLPHTWSAPAAQTVADVISSRRPGVGVSLADLLDRCWPLHPVTAALLGPASRRQFGQNERSVFGFLLSLEPHGFQDFLSDWDGRSAYGPDRYWDYLKANLEPAILSSSEGHRWAQAVEAVERAAAKGANPLELALVKSIATIDLFRSVSGLAAETPVLQSLVLDAPAETIDAALNRFAEWRVALLRKHLAAWTVFEGSDFDIEAAATQARGSFAEVDLQTLTGLANLHPVVAKRHYHQTGTFRWMGVSLHKLGEAARFAADYIPAGGEFGRIALVLPDRDFPAQDALQQLRALPFAPERPVIFGVPPNHAQVADLGAEFLSLKIVSESRPELQGDPVARREVAARLVAVQSALEEALRLALADAQWVFHGQIEKALRLSPLASDMADKIFADAPRIWSELVNRDHLSTSSVKARRDLMHRMVDHADQEALGLEGFPAERGLHETLLVATGLHGKNPESDAWSFMAPEANHKARLASMWSTTIDAIRDTGMEITADKLYTLWARPPYGIKEGIKPILLLALVLAHASAVAVYRDGVFIPALTDVDADELLQDPNKFSLRWVSSQGERKAALSAIAATLTELEFTPEGDTPLEVGRALVRLAFSLPPWARRTHRISKPATAIRDLLLKAKDPERLLFVDLPHAVGAVPADLGAGLKGPLKELIDAYPTMLTDVDAHLVQALDASPSDYADLSERAAIIAHATGDLRLDGFAARLQQRDGSRASIEGILSLAANKPPRDWTDIDIDAAKVAVTELAMAFRRAEMLVKVDGRTPGREAFAVVIGAAGQARTLTKTFEVAARDRQAITTAADQVISLLKASGLQGDLLYAALATAGTVLTHEIDHPADKGDG